MAKGKSKKKPKGEIRNITPEMKKKARLGAEGHIGMVMSGGGKLLVRGAKALKKLVAKKVINKMSNRKKKKKKKKK